MTFTDWDGKKYLVKVKSYNIFKTISAADTKYHYLCSGMTVIQRHHEDEGEHIWSIKRANLLQYYYTKNVS